MVAGTQGDTPEVGVVLIYSFFSSYLFVCLFVVIKPDNPFFASRLWLGVKPMGVCPLGPRSSSCGPTKGTPPPGDTLHANHDRMLDLRKPHTSCILSH